MAKEFFDDLLAEIMTELNRPTNRIHSDKINKKLNIFSNFIYNECRYYNLKNGSSVSNYSNTFMIHNFNSNINNLYDKQPQEKRDEMDNQESRLIHKLIPMSYNIHDYYDGIVNDDIPLLVDFFNRDTYLFNELMRKMEKNVKKYFCLVHNFCI